MWQLIPLAVLIFSGSDSVMAGPSWQKCLPSNVKVSDVIFVEPGQFRKTGKKLTVKESLNQLRARCRDGKLVDSNRREIYFYRLVGCWGNPPMNYLEILDRQRRELADLKKRYTLIQISCNPSGKPIP